MKVKAVSNLILMFIILIVSACSIGEPEDSNSFDKIEFSIGSSSYLFNQIDNATSSVYLAIREINQTELVLYLNNAAAKGLDVRLVLDYDYSGLTSALYTNIGITYGNKSGDMSANFAVIDGVEAVFLSTAQITNQKTMYIKIRDRDIIEILKTEFNQMYSYNRFASGADGGSKKLTLNHMTVFNVDQDIVELYFLPQNNLFTYIVSRMGQTRTSVYSTLSLR